MFTINEAIADKSLEGTPTETNEDITWPEDLGIHVSSLSEEIFIIPGAAVAEVSEVERLIARKIDSRTLLINETPQGLTPAEVRSLNILLLNRTTPIKQRVIQEITETNKTLVLRSLSGLRSKLITAAGESLLIKNGENATYALHPGLEIVDSVDSEKEPTIPEMRRSLLGDFVVARAVEDTEAQAQLRHYGNLATDIEGNGKYEILTPSDIGTLFEQFDQGAATYQQGRDLSDKAVVQGLIAWHKIFYSGLGIARSRAFMHLSRARQEGNTDAFGEYVQIGAIALWDATLDFDQEKASFAHYAMIRIGSSLSHHAMYERRHQHFATMRALYAQDRGGSVEVPGGRAKAILAAESASVIDPIQLSIAQLTQQRLVRHVFGHDLLKPSEALVLSLGYGIHTDHLDGLELETSKGTLVYTEDLKENVIFRQGLSDTQIGEALGFPAKQVNRIRVQALKKAHDIILTELYTKADREEFEQFGVASLFL